MKTIRTRFNARRFLDALEDGDSPTRACQRLRLARSAVYNWRNADSVFHEQWTRALAAGVDALEDECTRRALAGSDVMLMFALRARKPETYARPRLTDVQPAAGDDLTKLSTVELKRRLDGLRGSQGVDTDIAPIVLGSSVGQ